MQRARYVLTERAAADLREARSWSRRRWGREPTNRYFDDLHGAARFIAQNQRALHQREDPSGGTALFVHAVREHYFAYEPLGERSIVIVAVIRQGRDLPAILRKWSVPIRRELAGIRARLERGEIPLRRAPAGRRRP